MNFFQTLNEHFPDADLNMRIKSKNDVITISLMPQGKTTIQPLIVSGSAEELDAGFFGLIVAPLKDTTLKLLNLDQHKESVDAAEKEVKKPATTEKAKASSKKTDPKPAVKKQAEKPALKEVDMFASDAEKEDGPIDETSDDDDDENDNE